MNKYRISRSSVFLWAQLYFSSTEEKEQQIYSGSETNLLYNSLNYVPADPDVGEGNGNPIQCSCLENPRTGAWWAAVSGVTQSQTRLRTLSSSSLDETQEQISELETQ